MDKKYAMQLRNKWEWLYLYQTKQTFRQKLLLEIFCNDERVSLSKWFNNEHLTMESRNTWTKPDRIEGEIENSMIVARKTNYWTGENICKQYGW